MDDLINLTENADAAEFAPFLEANEVKGLVSETATGKLHIVAMADADLIGKRVVRFEMVRGPSERRRTGPFLGFRKVATSYIVAGAGNDYNKDGKAVRNFYLIEG